MAEYLNPTHRQHVQRLQQSLTARTEWPTWLLVLVIYGGWVLLAMSHQRLGPWLGSALLAVQCAWFMSLQHELVHGHPTRWRGFNKLLGYAPLAVWFPFALYVETHTAHHSDEQLTLPGVDPESNYVSPAQWQQAGALGRWLYRARLSFWGRFLLGPAMAVASIAQEELDLLRRGDLRRLPMWLGHGALTVLMLWGLQRYAGIHPLLYLFAIAYPALSITMVRSFFEHRATALAKHRIVINEASWPLRLLYLNNNYHLVHHDMPSLPWYLIPAAYRPFREDYLARCGQFRFDGYAPLAGRFGFRPIDHPIHPGLVERPAP